MQKFKKASAAIMAAVVILSSMTAAGLSGNLIAAAENPVAGAAAADNNTATALTSEHKHTICTGSDCTDASHTEIEWTAWSDESSLPADAGSYYLTVDVTINDTWQLNDNITNLCLNGHTIRYTKGDDSIILVFSGAELNLCDCSAGKTGLITGTADSCVLFDSYSEDCPDAVFSMYSGTIGGITHDGIGDIAAVHCDHKFACFHMYGGSIVNNSIAGVGVNNGDRKSVV